MKLVEWIEGAPLDTLGPEAEAELRREFALLAESYDQLLGSIRQVHIDLLVEAQAKAEAWHPDPHLHGIAQGQAQRGAALASTMGAISNQAMLRAITGGGQ